MTGIQASIWVDRFRHFHFRHRETTMWTDNGWLFVGIDVYVDYQISSIDNNTLSSHNESERESVISLLAMKCDVYTRPSSAHSNSQNDSRYICSFSTVQLYKHIDIQATTNVCKVLRSCITSTFDSFQPEGFRTSKKMATFASQSYFPLTNYLYEDLWVFFKLQLTATFL